MKKLLLTLILVASATFSNAQVTGPKLTAAAIGNLRSAPTHAVTDTITDATPEYQYAIIGDSNIHVTLQCTLTKLSGTVAGTVKPQGSIDGVLYTDIAGQTAFTLTNVTTQTCSFVIAPSSYKYYRIAVTPSGTQSTTIATKALIRKYP